MTNGEKIARMLAAQEHVEAVLNDLDLSGEACECCQAMRYTNFDDYNLGKKLQGISEKLDVEIGKMRGAVAKRGKRDD